MQAVDEYLDWQALDKARSSNTVRAYSQDLAMFVAYAGVSVLAQGAPATSVSPLTYPSCPGGSPNPWPTTSWRA